MTDDQRAGAGEALKACAHCNGEAKQQRKEQEGYGPAFAVMCTACACSTPWVDTMGWAFALWNLRASDKREGEGEVHAAAEDLARLHMDGDRLWLAHGHKAVGRLLAPLSQPKPAGEAGGWVSVEDRWPEGNCIVLTYRPEFWHEDRTVSAQSIGVDFFDDDDHEFHGSYHGPAQVTHWMPLPKPPEPKTGEGGQ